MIDINQFNYKANFGSSSCMVMAITSGKATSQFTHKTSHLHIQTCLEAVRADYSSFKQAPTSERRSDPHTQDASMCEVGVRHLTYASIHHTLTKFISAVYPALNQEASRQGMSLVD